MAEIFISHKSERRKAAEHLAQILRCYGYSVWFDYGLIKGRDFGLQLDAKIREAKAVIVLWCARSVRSRWVAEEVDLGLSLGSLAPVMIEKCELPAGFRRIDAIDLSGWDGAPRTHMLDKLWDTLEFQTGRAPQLDLKTVRAYEETWRRLGAPTLRAFPLEAPLDVAEKDRKLGQAPEIEAPVAPVAIVRKEETGGSHVWMLAAQEWPAARESRDIARLRRFEVAFAGTYYAGEARVLREALEAANARLAKEARAVNTKDDRPRAEGRIHIPGAIAHGAPEGRFLPGAGKTEWFRDFPGAPEMVVVPAGSYLMGSPDSEPERASIEGPRHEVTIAKPFAVGRFAVTFEEWDAALAAGGVQHKPADQGFGRGRQPVINVSWKDAKAYVAWLNGKVQGEPYRLLSEAEWEYACRAGTATPYWWGSSISPAQANYDGTADPYKGGGARGEYRQKLLPVESFQANPWGLYQVHGNVWEWCEDCWNVSYKGAPADGSAWTSGNCASRLLRGGGWNFFPWNLRAAARVRLIAGDRCDFIGLRVARSL
jgi:formylglycine-generating enzyme required for sulfatase activity